MVAASAGADLQEIAPAQKYTRQDLNWLSLRSRSTLEMKDSSSRPALAAPATGIGGYDCIFIGFPIWWWTAPKIVRTFIESADFSGKTVIPFATSGSSGIAKACRHLQESYPQICWKEGKLLNKVTQETVDQWVKEVL